MIKEKTYDKARVTAQGLANETGADHAVEWNKYDKCYFIWRLPRWRERSGIDYTVESVWACPDTRCSPGHGPSGRVSDGPKMKCPPTSQIEHTLEFEGQRRRALAKLSVVEHVLTTQLSMLERAK